MRWLYLYADGLEIPVGFAVVDFESGPYAVATDIDQKPISRRCRFSAENGLEREDGRSEPGHIMTSPNAQKIPSYSQMDSYTPVRPKK